MALRRCISTSLSTSRKHAALPSVIPKLAEFCQALFPFLIVHADDFGRLPGDAFTVKHMCWPTSPRPLDDFERALAALHQVGMVYRYSVDGRQFAAIVDFEKHQAGLHKRTKSKFPEPPGDSSIIPEIPGSSGNGRVIPSEENRTEQKGREEERTALGFAKFWDRYPKKKAKPDALRAWKALNPSDALVSTILQHVDGERGSDEWQKDAGKFIPHPARYLRQQRWTDEGVQIAAAAPRRTPVSEPGYSLSCEHQPQCRSITACNQRYLAETKQQSATEQQRDGDVPIECEGSANGGVAHLTADQEHSR